MARTEIEVAHEAANSYDGMMRWFDISLGNEVLDKVYSFTPTYSETDKLIFDEFAYWFINFHNILPLNK